MRIAVPDADNQLNRNTAGSAVGFATTGGMRSTILSRPGIGMLGAEMWLRNPFTCGVPHAKTITIRITHGISATRSGTASPVGTEPADVAPRRQCLRKNAKQNIEQPAARMSTSHGP